MELNVERPSYEQARAYIKENCTLDRKSRKKGIYKVVTPLKVFKKARIDSLNKYGERKAAIISLLIPSGALIYAGEGWDFPRNYDMYDSERKMRASEAYVHSITDIGNAGWGSSFEHAVEVQEAVSNWDSDFKYTVGKNVTPKFPFSKENRACRS